jgi:hypothetical protein
MRTIQNVNDVKTYKDFLDFTNESIILCNNIAKDYDELQLENGEDIDKEGIYNEVYQYYIISDNLAEYIKRFTNDILYYHNKLDIYVWGITHYGTSWGSVDIEIKKQ